MTSDPIADMLTRVRNAITARHPKVDVPASKLKTEIARILKEEGYIINYKVAEEGRQEDHQDLSEVQPDNVAGDLRASSAFRARAAASTSAARRFPRVLGGLGVNILTTPRGVMTGRDARKEGVGGEVLCQIW